MTDNKLAEALRERFEKWISAQDWFHATIGLDRSGDEYSDSCINSRWQGWQAHAAEAAHQPWTDGEKAHFKAAADLVAQREAEAAQPQAQSMEAIRRAVARGWCAPVNAHKVMDPDLADAIAQEVSAMFAAPQAQAAEPVAWMTRGACTGEPVVTTARPDDPNVAEWAPLYMHPQPAQDAEAKWQPIETAPKDGTRILAWCVHDNAKYAAENDRADWQGPVVAHWIDFNGGGWCWHGHCGMFTHWMPLPEPPKMAREATNGL